MLQDGDGGLTDGDGEEASRRRRSSPELMFRGNPPEEDMVRGSGSRRSQVRARRMKAWILWSWLFDIFEIWSL